MSCRSNGGSLGARTWSGSLRTATLAPVLLPPPARGVGRLPGPSTRRTYSNAHRLPAPPVPELVLVLVLVLALVLVLVLVPRSSRL